MEPCSELLICVWYACSVQHCACMHTSIKSNIKNCLESKDGTAGSKSTQTRAVGITDKVHPYIFFIETLLLDVGMHLVCYPYYYCCVLFGPAVPSLFSMQFLCCFLYLLLLHFCETLIGPNHHEGSSRIALNLELSVNDVHAISNHDRSVQECLARCLVPQLISKVASDWSKRLKLVT